MCSAGGRKGPGSRDDKGEGRVDSKKVFVGGWDLNLRPKGYFGLSLQGHQIGRPA